MEEKEHIDFSDFLRVDMRVGRIMEAERIEGSDKLLKLKVSLGSEVRRIIAGIGKGYGPESLPGKQIIVVANLKPREIFGEMSEGMLLAVGGKDAPILLSPEKEAPEGERVS